MTTRTNDLHVILDLYLITVHILYSTRTHRKHIAVLIRYFEDPQDLTKFICSVSSLHCRELLKDEGVIYLAEERGCPSALQWTVVGR
jgi:hypothetical protein